MLLHIRRTLVTYVPNHPPTSKSDIHRLKDFLISCKGDVIVLTGAGISTESGIPDYRSEGVGLYARSNHKPMSYQEFVKNPISRQRYWARSFVGWPKFSSVSPNCTHHTLVQLEENGIISCIVTQNVDSLHQKAGSKHVIELHGTLSRVHCLSCDHTVDRHQFQTLLDELNPTMQTISKILRPDGDVDLNDVILHVLIFKNAYFETSQFSCLLSFFIPG